MTREPETGRQETASAKPPAEVRGGGLSGGKRCLGRSRQPQPKSSRFPCLIPFDVRDRQSAWSGRHARSRAGCGRSIRTCANRASADVAVIDSRTDRLRHAAAGRQGAASGLGLDVVNKLVASNTADDTISIVDLPTPATRTCASTTSRSTWSLTQGCCSRSATSAPAPSRWSRSRRSVKSAASRVCSSRTTGPSVRTARCFAANLGASRASA